MGGPPAVADCNVESSVVEDLWVGGCRVSACVCQGLYHLRHPMRPHSKLQGRAATEAMHARIGMGVRE